MRIRDLSIPARPRDGEVEAAHESQPL
jgi:hypothetical protein